MSFSKRGIKEDRYEVVLKVQSMESYTRWVHLQSARIVQYQNLVTP